MKLLHKDDTFYVQVDDRYYFVGALQLRKFLAPYNQSFGVANWRQANVNFVDLKLVAVWHNKTNLDVLDTELWYVLLAMLSVRDRGAGWYWCKVGGNEQEPVRVYSSCSNYGDGAFVWDEAQTTFIHASNPRFVWGSKIPDDIDCERWYKLKAAAETLINSDDLPTMFENILKEALK